MVVSDMRSWMVMFAIDLTSIPPEKVSERSEVIERYKKSALECGIGSPNNLICIDNVFPVNDGVWSKPTVDVVHCSGSEIGGVLVIEDDLSSPNGVWTAPNKPIEIGETKETYMGNWKSPIV